MIDENENKDDLYINEGASDEFDFVDAYDDDDSIVDDDLRVLFLVFNLGLHHLVVAFAFFELLSSVSLYGFQLVFHALEAKIIWLGTRIARDHVVSNFFTGPTLRRWHILTDLDCFQLVGALATIFECE